MSELGTAKGEEMSRTSLVAVIALVTALVPAARAQDSVSPVVNEPVPIRLTWTTVARDLQRDPTAEFERMASLAGIGNAVYFARHRDYADISIVLNADTLCSTRADKGDKMRLQCFTSRTGTYVLTKAWEDDAVVHHLPPRTR